MRRKLRKNGNSWGLVLPKLWLQQLGVDGDSPSVDVQLVGHQLVITADKSLLPPPPKPAPTLSRTPPWLPVFAAWTQLCEPRGFPKPLRRDNDQEQPRSNALRAKLARAWQRQRKERKWSATGWESYMKRVARSPFLLHGSGTWRGASLEWVVKPANIDKVLSGQYDPRSSGPDTNTNTDNYDFDSI